MKRGFHCINLSFHIGCFNFVVVTTVESVDETVIRTPLIKNCSLITKRKTSCVIPKKAKNYSLVFFEI